MADIFIVFAESSADFTLITFCSCFDRTFYRRRHDLAIIRILFVLALLKLN